jgi:peptidoglycan/LPS O-acetylase OafA/YrhL
MSDPTRSGSRKLLTEAIVAILVTIAGYSIYVALYSASTAQGYDPSIFWTAIGVFFFIAAGALVVAIRLWRKHLAPPSTR